MDQKDLGKCSIGVETNVAALLILTSVSSIVGIVAFILWIVLMLKAYQGELFKLPIIGDIAEKQVK